MKQIELSLKERLLIVEFEDEKECIFKVYREYGTLNAQALCKGSELTEEIAKEFVEDRTETYSMWFNGGQCYKGADGIVRRAEHAFITFIEAQGYYWGESADKILFNVTEYSVGDWGDLGNKVGNIEGYDKESAKKNYQKLNNITDYDINFFSFNEAESRTFNPEKSIIFKIV